MSCCHDGTYYILAYNDGGTLRVKYAVDPDTIKTSGAEAYSDAALTTESPDTRSYFAMRLQNGTIHLGYFRDTGADKNTFYYTSTADITGTGLTDNLDAAAGGEDLFEISDVDVGDLSIMDVFVVDSIPCALIPHTINPDTINFYELNTFMEVDNLASRRRCSVGNLNDGMDVYTLAVEFFNVGVYDLYLYEFDGTTITQKETIVLGVSVKMAYNTFYYVNTLYFTKGPYIYVSAGDALYIRFYTDTIWTTIVLSGFVGETAQYTWEKNTKNPEVRFIRLGGAIDALYYLTPKGYMVKIQTSVTSNCYQGVHHIFYPYEIVPTAYNPGSKIPITGGRFIPQAAKLTHVGTDYTKGDGIVLTDDSDNVKFIGVIPPEGGIKNLGGVAQELVFYSPGKFDLMEKVDYTFAAQTVPQMLTTDLLETRYYYKGTFDAFASTYNYECNQLPRWEFWKDMEELSILRIHKSDEFGQIDLDDGTDSSGTTVTHANMMRLPIVSDQGAGFNRILVIGGPKADGTGLAFAAYDIPTSADQQINLVTFTKPNLLTDAACLTAATNLGDNMSSAFKKYTFAFIDQGKPLEGETISFAYSPLGISAVDVIVESYTYELLSEVYSCTCFNALHWRGIP